MNKVLQERVITLETKLKEYEDDSSGSNEKAC